MSSESFQTDSLVVKYKEELEMISNWIDEIIVKKKFERKSSRNLLLQAVLNNALQTAKIEYLRRAQKIIERLKLLKKAEEVK